MLSKTTSHCTNGHALVPHDVGQRSSFMVSSDVKEVRAVAWCDVCIEPFDPQLPWERYSCAECQYDCCWECHDAGREAYYVGLQFEDGPQKGTTVWATMDVYKRNLVAEDIAEGAVTVSKAIGLFECDLYDVSFGVDALERKQIEANSSATFNATDGSMSTFSFFYINPAPGNDLPEYGGTINRFAINCEYETVPEAILNSGKDWFGCTFTGEEDELPTESYGYVIDVTRYRLADVPGFSTEATESKTIKMLRAIARDKRQIINPMRRQYMPDANGSCVTRLLRRRQADPKELLAANIRRKAEAQIKSNKIIDNLAIKSKYLESSTTGKVNHRDLIYANRLSLLAYMIDRIPFGQFFSADREKYLLDPMWVNFIEHLEQNEGRELFRQWMGQDAKKEEKLLDKAHEAFLAKFISTFFEQDSGKEDFGMSLELAGKDGPLSLLGLEYANMFPHKRGKEGAFQVSGTEGFIAVSKDLVKEGGDICIVFQGTNDKRDMWINMNGVSTPFEPMVDSSDAGNCSCLQGRVLKDGDATTATNPSRVHVGFYNAFLKLREPIDAYLRKILKQIPKDKHVRIVVTGHSLGGALATICCGWLLQLFDESYTSASASFPVIADEHLGTKDDRLRILCVTFGSPKCGNEAYVKWMDGHKFVKKNDVDGTVRAKILRLIDVMDPIVTLPPSSGGFSYRHTAWRGATVSTGGDMVFITRESADAYDDTTRGLGVILTKGASGAAQNHDLVLYLHKCLHFAWNFNKVGEGKEFDDDPLERAFGAPNLAYDKFTKEPDFLKKF